MSNIIKAFNIRYTSEKKKIDMNQRAEEFQRLYIESLPKYKEIEDAGEQELHEEYFQEDEIENSESLEEFHKHRELAKQKLEEEMNILKEAAVEECRLLRMDAEEECRNLIKAAVNEAETEKQKLFSLAKEEGYEQGKAKALFENEALRQELLEQKSRFEEEYQHKINELEADVAEVIIAAVANLTGIMLNEQQGVIMYMIRHAMLGSESSQSFLIRVSKEDFDFVNQKKQELLLGFEDKKIEIVRDPILNKGQGTIETDSRIIDFSLDEQLKNLSLDLRLLAGSLDEVTKESL